MTSKNRWKETWRIEFAMQNRHINSIQLAYCLIPHTPFIHLFIMYFADACVCRLEGDPEVLTFDRMSLYLTGDHKYTLTKDTFNTSDPCSFDIKVKVKALLRQERTRYALTMPRYIEINLLGYNVILGQNHRIKVSLCKPRFAFYQLVIRGGTGGCQNTPVPPRMTKWHQISVCSIFDLKLRFMSSDLNLIAFLLDIFQAHPYTMLLWWLCCIFMELTLSSCFVTQWTHDVIITSLLRQNVVLAYYWRYYCVAWPLGKILTCRG